MKKTIFLISAFLTAAAVSFSSSAFANEFAITGGLRYDNADSSVKGVTTEARMNFQAGALGFMELGGKHNLRGGFEFVTRTFGAKSAGVSLGDARFTNVDIPATYLYRFSDYGGVFVGPVFSFNFSKDCPGTCTGVVSSPVGLQFGASFKTAPQLGAEVYFEMVGSKFADGIENPKALVGQIYFTFE